MKLKIMRYGVYPRHNEIVEGWTDAEKVNDRVYIRFYTRSDCYPPEYCEVILNVGGVFFEHSDYPKSAYETADFIPSLTGYAESFIETVNRNAEAEGHIPLLFIKVFERLGLDTAHLWLSRDRFREKREAGGRIEADRQKRLQEEEAHRERVRLGEAKKKFMAGDKIGAGDFLIITKSDGFQIHIRTMGTLNRSVTALDRYGKVWVRRKPGKALPKVDGCHRAIDGYLEFLGGVDAAVESQPQKPY